MPAVMIMIALLVSCSEKKPESVRMLYQNNPDIRSIPQSPDNLDAFGFSDMGAWHAYTLPSPDTPAFFGGFCGPLLMKNSGRWLGKISSLLSFVLPDGSQVQWISGKSVLTSLPGILKQTHHSEEMSLNQQLIFADNRTALITNTLANRSKEPLVVEPMFRSSLFPGNYEISRAGNTVVIRMDDSTYVCTCFGNNDFDLAVDPEGYTVTFKNNITVSPVSDVHIDITQSYFFTVEEMEKGMTDCARFIETREDLLAFNSERWDGWLNEILGRGNSWMDTASYRALAVKSLQTLVSNWRSPAGALRHNGIFPSTAYQGFYGFWSWDSWKHAAALARFFPFLATESIKSMFDYQDSTGMVADCIYFSPGENNWRDTKPPVSAWAVSEIFAQTGDTLFVREILPQLLSYHRWWYAYRDHDRNGLCEYGSTDGTLIAAKWESGMDNAVRFDESKLIASEGGGWSIDQESVDLNTFLVVEKNYISELCKVAGINDEGERFAKDSEALKELVLRTFWSDSSMYFMDRKLEGDTFISHFGPEGWLPLWAGICSDSQANEVSLVMTDQGRFNTFVPLPTLDRSDPGYDPENGYWRGPVWLDQFYFGVTGLRNYGYQKEADELIYKLFMNASGMLESSPVYENYHPETGAGLNAAHFSWSAAHLLLLLTDIN